MCICVSWLNWHLILGMFPPQCFWDRLWITDQNNVATESECQWMNYLINQWTFYPNLHTFIFTPSAGQMQKKSENEQGKTPCVNRTELSFWGTLTSFSLSLFSPPLLWHFYTLATVPCHSFRSSLFPISSPSLMQSYEIWWNNRTLGS